MAAAGAPQTVLAQRLAVTTAVRLAMLTVLLAAAAFFYLGGALDAMLSKIADFYEEEVDVAVAAMTSLIEPVMMVGIGGTVGVVLIAMYLPIFSIAGKIKAD